MTKDIYDVYDAATRRMAAYALVSLDGEHVGRVVVKYPEQGAGTVRAFVHIFGCTVAQGTARGYGYDKAHAAICEAVALVPYPEAPSDARELRSSYHKSLVERVEAVKAAFAADNGGGAWVNLFLAAGVRPFAAI